MKLGHVHLKVNDLEQAKNFYCKVLGLKITEEISNHYAFLSFDKAHHDLALQKSDSNLKQGSLYHIAYEVSSVKALLDYLNKLQALNITHTIVDHGISWAIYLNDPEDNGIEIYLDRRDAGKEYWQGHSRRITIQDIEKAI